MKFGMLPYMKTLILSYFPLLKNKISQIKKADSHIRNQLFDFKTKYQILSQQRSVRAHFFTTDAFEFCH